MAQRNISTSPRIRWDVDPENTTIEFAIGKSPLHRVSGRFHGAHGWVITSGGRVSEALIQVEIQAATIDTRSKLRDWHLRTSQFLAVKRFPTILFASTRVEDHGSDGVRVFGDLTIRDITQEVVLEAQVEHDDDERVRIVAHTMLDRRDFKIGPKAMGLVVGNDVAVEIALELNAR